MKQTIIVWLAATIMAALAASSSAGTYSGGSGTPDDPYQIGTAEDIIEMSGIPDDWDKHFVMIADVDMAGHTFTEAVIGTFKGRFDGRGHVIHNLKINIDGHHRYLGLFDGIALGSEVRNLGVIGVFDGGGYYSGGGALCDWNGGTISNCYSTGSVISGDDYSHSGFGGLCGSNSGTIKDCRSAASVLFLGYGDEESGYIGGLCGRNGGTISDCYSTGSVRSESLYTAYIGGLSGSNGGTISNCYSTGPVVAGGGAYGVGGLCAVNSGIITDCDSSSSVIAGDDAWGIGGLCGYNLGTIKDSYASGIVEGDNGDDNWGSPGWWPTGPDDIGGLCGYNGEEGTVINCHSTSSVKSGYASEGVGGLCGDNRGTIRDSYAKVPVLALCETKRAGGLCGENFGTISNCYASGNLESLVSLCRLYSGGTLPFGPGHLGGLCGSSEGTVINCYSRGSVTGVGSGSEWVGGLCGRSDDGTFIDCYSTGSVGGGHGVGGLFGRGVFATISNCFWDVEASGRTSTSGGGTGLSTDQMQTLTTFTDAGWDFVNIWYMRDGVEYPQLRVFNEPPVADAGEDVELLAPVDGLVEVTLDGTASFDPEGEVLEYFWFDDASDLIATGAAPNVTLPTGEHVFDLIVNDGIFDSEPDQVVITAIGPMEAGMMFVPRVLNLRSRGQYVMAILCMPEGVLVSDLDADEPWRLLPGDIEAVSVRTISHQRWQIVRAVFDRDELINAIDLPQQEDPGGRRRPHSRRNSSTEAEIVVYSKLATGQTIFGTDTVRVIQNPPRRHWRPNNPIGHRRDKRSTE